MATFHLTIKPANPFLFLSIRHNRLSLCGNRHKHLVWVHCSTVHTTYINLRFSPISLCVNLTLPTPFLFFLFEFGFFVIGKWQPHSSLFHASIFFFLFFFFYKFFFRKAGKLDGLLNPKEGTLSKGKSSFWSLYFDSYLVH